VILIQRTATAAVADESEALPILDDVDWTFADRSRIFAPGFPSPFDCREHHWYPATYIPEIPYTLTQVLTRPNATVLDPFGGIGTTFFQSLVLMRQPWTSDINSVALLFMTRLLGLFDPGNDLLAARESIQGLQERYDPRVDYRADAARYMRVESLTSWFGPQTLNQLAFLVLQERGLERAPAGAALGIAISASLNSLHGQRRGWTWVADNAAPHPEAVQDKDVFRPVVKRATRLLCAVEEAVSELPGRDFAAFYRDTLNRNPVVHESATRLERVPENSVDAIVTSPPYPSMTDYVASQRLSFYVNGRELEPLSKDADFVKEIGPRRHRRRKDALERYDRSMREATAVMSSKLRRGGYMCLVLPKFSTASVDPRGAAVRAVVDSAIEDCGMRPLREYHRFLPPSRRHHNQTFTRLDEETIFVLRKD